MLQLLIVLLTFTQSPKIEGPKTATVGYMTKIRLIDVDVDDLKIKAIPENPDWIAVKDFDGTPYIIFVPGKKTIPPGQKTQLVTFVLAGNKDKKTYLNTHEITVVPDGAPPDVTPTDDVKSTQLFKDMQSQYMVAPDASAKANLQKVYEGFLVDVNADKFKNNGEAIDSLALVSKQIVDGGSDVRKIGGVRDVVADYLSAKTGTSRSAWDKTKLATAMQDVIACIKVI